MNSEPSNPQPQFTAEELQAWHQGLEEANRHNIWCHCRICDREWVASSEVPCECGSKRVEYIACWQFPDD